MNLENIGAEDIVDGNPRLILGLIWTIILRSAVSAIYTFPLQIPSFVLTNIDCVLPLDCAACLHQFGMTNYYGPHILARRAIVCMLGCSNAFQVLAG